MLRPRIGSMNPDSNLMFCGGIRSTSGRLARTESISSCGISRLLVYCAACSTRGWTDENDEQDARGGVDDTAAAILKKIKKTIADSQPRTCFRKAEKEGKQVPWDFSLSVVLMEVGRCAVLKLKEGTMWMWAAVVG